MIIEAHARCVSRTIVRTDAFRVVNDLLVIENALLVVRSGAWVLHVLGQFEASLPLSFSNVDHLQGVQLLVKYDVLVFCRRSRALQMCLSPLIQVHRSLAMRECLPRLVHPGDRLHLPFSLN